MSSIKSIILALNIKFFALASIRGLVVVGSNPALY